MNPYGLLASGAHLTGGSRLPEAIHDTRELGVSAFDDVVARRALKSVNAIERLARRLLGQS